VVVLVHGSFHTPEATWAELTPLLDERGVEWTAVDLPSAGPDGTTDEPAPDLSDDVAVTLDAIEQVGGPVVLVGHPYGGAVITGAGVDPSVENLFYLCAFAPERDETTIELTTSGPPVALAGALRIDDGLVSVDPALAVEVLHADVDPELAATMVAKLVPSTLSSLEQPVTDAAWMTVSSSYLICEQDEAIAPERQREMADRIGAETFSLPSSHTPFLSQPGAVADLNEQVVQQAET
jgi:pimeloyl-ACP methyl ester carboxylesterase